MIDDQSHVSHIQTSHSPHLSLPTPHHSSHPLSVHHISLNTHLSTNIMSPKSSPKSKKKEVLTKKAPGAPKRFKSSYILFFMHVQEEIKKKLPPGTHTVSYHFTQPMHIDVCTCTTSPAHGPSKVC